MVQHSHTHAIEKAVASVGKGDEPTGAPSSPLIEGVTQKLGPWLMPRPGRINASLLRRFLVLSPYYFCRSSVLFLSVFISFSGSFYPLSCLLACLSILPRALFLVLLSRRNPLRLLSLLPYHVFLFSFPLRLAAGRLQHPTHSAGLWEEAIRFWRRAGRW